MHFGAKDLWNHSITFGSQKDFVAHYLMHPMQQKSFKSMKK
jgi:hypothetical protein